ncbi:MAG: hypothetical protein CMH61_01640 [Nanoarchaeota archaeon]|nr:hypothetical protein [Nanoarchaeota archaeon]|tara:strand:+ start:5605 stop:5919 length:315 start_codon:yes stop_codon:yes gene_type:complete
MKKRGRPVKSEIRNNVLEIVHHLGKGYGYQIAKAYNSIFPKVSQRSVYYHLRKGVQLDELKVSKIKMEKGDYSWGDKAEKIYYSLGRLGSAKGDGRVKEFFRKK